MMQIVPLTENLGPAVKEFNDRMHGTGASAFPASPLSPWLPKVAGRRIYEEPFVAVEDGAVHGGYMLIRHEMCIGGRMTPMAGLRLAISEGLVDGKYRLVGVQVVKDALRREPLLSGMGMGGKRKPIARLLKAMGWNVTPVPFYFRLNRAARFLRDSGVLRPWAARLARYSGAAWAGVQALDLALVRNRRLGQRLRVEAAGSFGEWADRIWEAAQERYSAVAARDREVLNLLYPPDDQRYLRLQVWDGERLAGWAVVLDLHLRNHPYFGCARAGQIVDCLALPEDADCVIRGTCEFLEERGVDFLRSHQSHPAWRRALRRSGFLPGPSYFLFAASPALAEALRRVDGERTGLHINRGDGDGPLYLPRKGVPAQEPVKTLQAV